MEKELTTNDWNMVSEVELVYKSKVKPSLRPVLKSVTDVVDFFRTYWELDKLELREQFKVIYLNRANRILGICDHSTGGIDGALVEIRHLFATGLKLNATCLILAHNHPSGNLRPSENDLRLTEKLKNAGELLNIRVVDHIILTTEEYLSFSSEGLL